MSYLQYKGAKRRSRMTLSASGRAGRGLYNYEEMVTVGVVEVWLTLYGGAPSRQGSHTSSSQRWRRRSFIKNNIHQHYDRLWYKRLWPISLLTLVVKGLCHFGVQTCGCGERKTSRRCVTEASWGHDVVVQQQQQWWRVTHHVSTESHMT